MSFDPTLIADDATGEGHLDDTPIYELLLSVKGHQATGRLSIADASGENHMYFMRGQPVGVQLAEFFHPLGQLLLELARIDASTFVRAQRLIGEGNRLPGQVFKEIGVLDDDGLKEILAVQARRKAEQFCRLGSRPFIFARGLTFLSGFNSTPLDIHAVIYLALRQQMGPASRKAWLDGMRGQEVRLLEGSPALPAPLEVFGFGPPEDRFLKRLQSGWQRLSNLAETGTLPEDEMAVLLRLLQLIGTLQRRTPAPAAVPDDVFATTEPKAAPAPVAVRSHTENTDPGQSDIHNVPTDLSGAPVRRSPAPEGFRAEVRPEDLKPPPPKKKKRRRRRSEPLPSVRTTSESEARREKTNISELPTIMIDE